MKDKNQDAFTRTKRAIADTARGRRVQAQQSKKSQPFGQTNPDGHGKKK